MSARPGVLATVRIPADGGEHPNKQVGEITAEVRCHWPDGARFGDIREAVHRAAGAALAQARAEIDRRAARDGARDARAGHGGAGGPGSAASEAREGL